MMIFTAFAYRKIKGEWLKIPRLFGEVQEILTRKSETA